MSLLKVLVAPLGGMFELNTTSDGNVIVTGGQQAEMFNMVIRGLKQPYQLSKLDVVQIGSQTPDGNWTGVLGMLNRGEFDLFICPLGLTLEKLKAIDMSYPYVVISTIFGTTVPKPLSKEKAFLKPFTFNVWMLVLAFVFGMPFTFRLLLSVALAISDLAIKVFGSILGQDFGVRPRRMRDTVIITTWILGAYLISLTYSSLLLSSLVLPNKGKAVRTVRELSKAVVDGSYKCFVPKGTVYLKYLVNSEVPYIKEIGKRIEVLDVSSGQTLRDYHGNAAYIGEKTSILSQLGIRAMLSTDSFRIFHGSIGIRKNFPFKKELDFLIHIIWASGLYQKSQDDYYFRQLYAGYTDKSDTDHIKSLSIYDLAGSFFLLVFGNCTAVLVLIFEILYKKFAR